jgi:predicted RNA binding protein YcfA (HicA-like mRNA interferase family)
LKYSELTRKLRRLGVEFYRQAKGSHEKWWWPERGLQTTIPNHPGKEIASGTLRKILKDLGLTEDNLVGK